MTAVDPTPGFAADPACAGAWADWLKDRDRWGWPAVLAAVLAHADEDGPRELAALWFDENGDAARAEFVRVQVALANLVDRPLDLATLGTGPILRRRERELLAEHGSDATGGLPCWRDTDGRLCGVGSAGWGHEFRRGFIEAVTLPSAAWLRHADTLLAAAPVTEVTLTDVLHARQDADHVWFRGRRRVYKWGEPFGGLGSDVVRPLLSVYWPRVHFTLPA